MRRNGHRRVARSCVYGCHLHAHLHLEARTSEAYGATTASSFRSREKSSRWRAREAARKEGRGEPANIAGVTHQAAQSARRALAAQWRHRRAIRRRWTPSLKMLNAAIKSRRKDSVEAFAASLSKTHGRCDGTIRRPHRAERRVKVVPPTPRSGDREPASGE